MERIKLSEERYIKQFSTQRKLPHYIIYKDDLLSDMYSHNFLFIKSEEEIHTIVEDALQSNRFKELGYLRIETYFPIPKDIMGDYPEIPIFGVYDLMKIDPQKYTNIQFRKNCVIKPYESQYEDALIRYNLINNTELGEFAKRRIERKIHAYKTTPVRNYICMIGTQVMGSCELFIDGDIAKIDDFDILKGLRRQGYGSTMIRYLLEEALNEGVKMVYLVTDQEETAKDMYAKLGFTKIGNKYDLLIKRN